MRVRYSSNNSGGGWWLKDEDWQALAAAGWDVIWGGRKYFCRSSYPTQQAPPGRPEPCADKNDCPGHPRFDSYEAAAAAGEKGRWLRAIACEACLECETPADAIRSFEAATGQDASVEGCNCCGPPHSFSWEGDYASGDDVVEHLYPELDVPKTRREAAEQARRRQRGEG